MNHRQSNAKRNKPSSSAAASTNTGVSSRSSGRQRNRTHNGPVLQPVILVPNHLRSSMNSNSNSDGAPSLLLDALANANRQNSIDANASTSTSTSTSNAFRSPGGARRCPRRHSQPQPSHSNPLSVLFPPMVNIAGTGTGISGLGGQEHGTSPSRSHLPPQRRASMPIQGSRSRNSSLQGQGQMALPLPVAVPVPVPMPVPVFSRAFEDSHSALNVDMSGRLGEFSASALENLNQDQATALERAFQMSSFAGSGIGTGSGANVGTNTVVGSIPSSGAGTGRSNLNAVQHQLPIPSFYSHLEDFIMQQRPTPLSISAASGIDATVSSTATFPAGNVRSPTHIGAGMGTIGSSPQRTMGSSSNSNINPALNASLQNGGGPVGVGVGIGLDQILRGANGGPSPSFSNMHPSYFNSRNQTRNHLLSNFPPTSSYTNGNINANISGNTSTHPDINMNIVDQAFSAAMNDVASQTYHTAQQHAVQFANSLWEMEERNDFGNDSDDDDDDDDDSVGILERDVDVDVSDPFEFSLINRIRERARVDAARAIAAMHVGTSPDVGRPANRDGNGQGRVSGPGSDLTDSCGGESDLCARTRCSLTSGNTSASSSPGQRHGDATDNTNAGGSADIGTSNNGNGITPRRILQGTRRSARVASNANRNITNDGDSKPSAKTSTPDAASASVNNSTPETTTSVSTSARPRRMTRSMARAQNNAQAAAATTVVGGIEDAQPSAKTKNTRSSRKRCRSSSPDRKKSAKEELSSSSCDKREEEEVKNCCICLEEPTHKELSKLDGCSHSYCFSCIEKWAERENTCPQCKSRFTKIERVHKIKRRRANGTSPKESNVKKVKNRDQRADYRQQNSLQGFFAINSHGLNVIYSSTGGLFGDNDGPGELPVFLSNINRGVGGAAAMGTSTAASIAASILTPSGIYAANAVRQAARHFAVGVPRVSTHTSAARTTTRSRVSSPTRPGPAPSRRGMRLTRMTVNRNHLQNLSRDSSGNASAPDSGGGNETRIPLTVPDLYQNIAGRRLRHLRASRNIMPNARDAAAVAAASLAESVFETGIAVERGSRNRSFEGMAAMAGLAPSRSFALNGNERNAGASAENALEIIDSDED